MLLSAIHLSFLFIFLKKNNHKKCQGSYVCMYIYIFKVNDLSNKPTQTYSYQKNCLLLPR